MKNNCVLHEWHVDHWIRPGVSFDRCVKCGKTQINSIFPKIKKGNKTWRKRTI